jgi:YhcH/YjgK/YiaL family protein
MITTTLRRIDRYRGLSPELDRAIGWIRADGWESLAPGRYEIEGDRVLAMVSIYDTKPATECFYETHRKYIDVQMLVAGREYILSRDSASLNVKTVYSEDNDIEFQEDAPGEVQRAFLAPGIVVFLFPEDAHMPCLRIGEKAERVRKVVVKVRAF